MSFYNVFAVSKALPSLLTLRMINSCFGKLCRDETRSLILKSTTVYHSLEVLDAALRVHTKIRDLLSKSVYLFCVHGYVSRTTCGQHHCVIFSLFCCHTPNVSVRGRASERRRVWVCTSCVSSGDL